MSSRRKGFENLITLWGSNFSELIARGSLFSFFVELLSWSIFFSNWKLFPNHILSNSLSFFTLRIKFYSSRVTYFIFFFQKRRQTSCNFYWNTSSSPGAVYLEGIDNYVFWFSKFPYYSPSFSEIKISFVNYPSNSQKLKNKKLNIVIIEVYPQCEIIFTSHTGYFTLRTVDKNRKELINVFSMRR